MLRRLLSNVHVRLHRPRAGQIKRLLQRGIHAREHVHVLQVGAQTLELDRGPHLELKHACRVVCPLVEHVRGGLVSVLRGFDIFAVVPERDLKSHVSF